LRGWERNEERLAPGYSLDTIDAAIWVLRRPDGTAASYFGAWSVTREGVERAAREDRRRKRPKRRSALSV
jgi:hypothetical protein